MIDSIIENIHLCKYFTVVCEAPEPICDFILRELKRSATTVEATGAFSGSQKHVVYTVLSRGEAVRLRNYIKTIEPGAFLPIPVRLSAKAFIVFSKDKEACICHLNLQVCFWLLVWPAF